MGKIYWKSWLKRHWWKLLLPVILPMALYALWYIKKHHEYKEVLNYAMENFKDESFILQFLSPALIRKIS